MKKSFRKNPNFCLVDNSWEKPKSECLLDWWSIHHFYWQGFAYIILHHFLNIKSLKGVTIVTIFLTFIHILEEYFGNTSRISLEGIFVDKLGPLIDSKININLRSPDNDYIDNSIGDVLSGIVSNILIVIFWYKYNKLPYFYLLLSIPVLYSLNTKKKKLYNKKK